MSQNEIIKACSNCLYHGNCYQEECYTRIQAVCSDYQNGNPTPKEAAQ